MLTLRPQPPPTRPPDHIMFQRRGRSRQVSHTALARQASEERFAVAGNSLHQTPYLRATTIPAEWGVSSTSMDEKSELAPGIQAPRQLVDASLAQSIFEVVSEPVSPKSPNLALPKLPFLPSLSSSPPTSASLSPDYYDSPPSAPQSLEDQVHIAYALDDLHLAKVLLLKLKGIEVTSDDDPRIDAVQDEDFDFCFVPRGKLMDEADEEALLEKQRKEMKRLEERRRVDRLKTCERIWEQEKRRLREAKALVLQRKEAEERKKNEQMKRADEDARIRRAKEKEDAAEAERRARLPKPRTHGLMKAPRNVVSYDALGGSWAGPSHAPSSSSSGASSRAEEPFVYDFMPRQALIKSRPVSSQSLSSQSLAQPSLQTFNRPTYDESRCIPFTDVLASMQGPLFPIEPHTASTSHLKPKSVKQRNAELLGCLLKVVEYTNDERQQRKGKATKRFPLRRKDSNGSPCVACSGSSGSSSTSSSWLPSPVSPRRSWLSFGSSSSSVSTAATTPSTSPSPSWFGKSITSSPTSIVSSRPRLLSLSQISPPQTSSHSCRPHPHLSPIPLAESPLPIPVSNKRISLRSQSNLSASIAHNSSRRKRSTTPPGERVIRRVSQFVEFAKGFQNAYMNAALFSISVSSDSFEDRDIHDTFIVSMSEGWQSRKGPTPTGLKRLKHPGYRAGPSEVRIFLDFSAPLPSSESTPNFTTMQVPSIPLLSRYPSVGPPRTVLPNPLPYPIVFKPIPIPCRSPFRLHANIQLAQNTLPDNSNHNYTHAPWISYTEDNTGRYGATVSWRVRTVENPMYLRIKALHKIMWDRGTHWQGRAREGSLGAGREKVLKVAYEGVGRSWLGVGYWEGQVTC